MEGIQLFLKYLRSDLSINIKRTAMRGLFNLSSKNRNFKSKIMSELGYEFNLFKKDQLDPIIKSYLITLIKTN